MFYMLASIYHQIITREGLPHFWCTLPDLPYGIWNAAAMFQVELEQLASREDPSGVDHELSNPA
jgi:hypothetical protein